ncbi:MAG: hypothetical protein HY553_04695 [Elusimicrobia bacterium]|nr:hypothetical protein [Elusimicrobiota bacterium]
MQRALGADTAAIRARLKDLRWQAAGLRWLRHLSGHGHRRRANAALRDLASLAPRATEET